VVVNRGKPGFLYQAKLHGLHRQKTYAPGAPKRIRTYDLLIAHQTNLGDLKNIKHFQRLATDLDSPLSTLNYQLSTLDPPLSTLDSPLSTLRCLYQLSTLSSRLSTIYGLSTLDSAL